MGIEVWLQRIYHRLLPGDIRLRFYRWAPPLLRRYLDRAGYVSFFAELMVRQIAAGDYVLDVGANVG